MNKAFGVFVLLVIGALGAVYFKGGFSSWDPGKKGEETKAAITPGMSWSQVLDVDEPGKYQTIYKTKKKVDGEEVEIEDLGQPLTFDRGLFENDWKGKQIPDGFAFVYVYTHQVQFKVHFDPAGKVAFVEDMKTMADFLQTRKD